MGARLAGGAGGILVALPAAPFRPPHHATAWSPFLGTLFTAFPLAHQTRCHVQISGENRLARALPQTKGADFRGLQWLHWCKTQVIEFTHRAFIHYAGGVKTFGSLVNRRHQRTTVLLFHCISPLSTFQTQP